MNSACKGLDLQDGDMAFTGLAALAVGVLDELTTFGSVGGEQKNLAEYIRLPILLLRGDKIQGHPFALEVNFLDTHTAT